MDKEVREVVTFQTVVIAFVAMIASLIPVIAPGFLTYHFTQLNDQMRFLTRKHLIWSLILGYTVLSVLICLLGQPIKISLLLLTSNTASSLIFFFLSLFIEKKRNEKLAKAKELELLSAQTAK